MKKSYFLFLAFVSTMAFAQQTTTISFEASEGYQLGTLHQQNGWEVTEGSDGFIQNQVVTSAKASDGVHAFKNAYEPAFDSQWFPIFGGSKVFEIPAAYQNFTISYDVLATAKQGSDFEFTLFAINADEEYVPVAGVGIENRGMIYLIKDENYDFDYANFGWTENQWVNIKIEVTETEVKYYIDNQLANTIANFTQLDIAGFNMLHNNYGADAYYDNFIITTGTLAARSFNDTVVSVSPNPAQNHLSVILPTNEKVSEVVFYNLTGQQVLSTSQTQNIDVSTLANGTYFLKATTIDGSSFTKKIIKN